MINFYVFWFNSISVFISLVRLNTRTAVDDRGGRCVGYQIDCIFDRIFRLYQYQNVLNLVSSEYPRYLGCVPSY
eukprot:SAG11_NODE_453_length_9367_cov_7.801575_4_plen_74_part_00